MKETTSELGCLVSSLNLGSGKISIEKYVQLVGEEIVDAKYNMVDLVDVACSREVHLGLELNDEPTWGNDMDDQPTPIAKLSQAH